MIYGKRFYLSDFYTYYFLLFFSSFLHSQNVPIHERVASDTIAKSVPTLSPEIFTLHDKFRNDPRYGGFVLRGNVDSAKVEKFNERLDRAVYACVKMELKEPLSQLEKELCYTFGDYLDDPLSEDYLYEVSQTSDELKVFKMEERLAILEDRNLFIQVYIYKARERYDRQNLDPEIKQRSLDLLWENRFFFATVMHDPSLDRFLDHLPSRTEISRKLQELLLDRLFAVRLKMQEWELMHYFRNRPVEKALYHLNDQLARDSRSFAVIDFLTFYYADQEEPQVYDALFTDQHVSKYLKHDLSLIENINVSDQIGLKENVHLRAMYEKLLVFDYASKEQRDQVQLCLQAIMSACCSSEYKEEYSVVAKRLFDEIICDDVDAIVLYNKSLLQKICERPEELLHSCVRIVNQLQNGLIDGLQAQQLLDSLGHCNDA